jgi:uncharacterized protein YkwD
MLLGYSSDPRKLLYFVNRERQQAGLTPLLWSAQLAEAAQNHAFDMYFHGFYGHTSPEGRTPSDRARMAGYPHGAGENIAQGAYSVGSVHQAWMKSPDHKANILNARYRVIGCGRVGWYWVQNFGCVVE